MSDNTTPTAATVDAALTQAHAAIDAFERCERGIPQAHMAAKLAAEIRAAIATPAALTQEPVADWLTEKDVEFLCLVQACPGCKLNDFNFSYGDGVENEWVKAERLHLVEAVGGYKWKPLPGLLKRLATPQTEEVKS